MPHRLFQCQNEEAVSIEYAFLKNILKHKLIDDDSVMPDVFPVDYHMETDEFGISVPMVHAADRKGRKIAYRYSYPLTDAANLSISSGP